MIITNFNNKYVKIDSDFIEEVISNPNDYSSIDVSLNVNCCTDREGNPAVDDITIPIEAEHEWHIDLDRAVGLGASLDKVSVYNLTNNNQTDLSITPIDLSYVEDECDEEDCTLETFSGHFAPLFKDAFDDATGGNCTIIFDGNTVIITDLPANYIPLSVQYGTNIVPIIYNGNTGAFLSGSSLFITPDIYERTELVDGIYRIIVKINKPNNSYTEETNCSFIDIETKCQVASTLNMLLEESRASTSEKVSTMIHLLHYSLANASNCGCNCEDLCSVYTELYNLLNNIDPQIKSNCGC